MVSYFEQNYKFASPLAFDSRCEIFVRGIMTNIFSAFTVSGIDKAA